MNTNRKTGHTNVRTVDLKWNQAINSMNIEVSVRKLYQLRISLTNKTLEISFMISNIWVYYTYILKQFFFSLIAGLDTVTGTFECPCENCKEIFNCVTLWEQHQLWHHDSSQKYQCVKCGLLFARAIKNHVRVSSRGSPSVPIHFYHDTHVLPRWFRHSITPWLNSRNF